ncbi:MAG: hypothetical protein INF92_03110 [Rhodobacter sp.]|nr:hypothetical protein [Rhodobacter sp.]
MLDVVGEGRRKIAVEAASAPYRLLVAQQEVHDGYACHSPSETGFQNFSH